MSQTLKQLWKHSSSLIILSKNPTSTKINNFNYKVSVLLKMKNETKINLNFGVFDFKGAGFEAAIKWLIPRGNSIPGRCNGTCRSNQRLVGTLSEIRC